MTDSAFLEPDDVSDGTHFCSMCRQHILADVPRLKIHVIQSEWDSHNGKQYKRVCGFCLIDIVEKLDIEKLKKLKEEWTMNRVIKKL